MNDGAKRGRVILYFFMLVLCFYAFFFVLYTTNNFIWRGVFLDLHEIKDKARLRSVQFEMPSLALLKKLQGNPDHRQLQKLAGYFGRIREYAVYPQDAYGWQGWCYYLMGENQKARQAYQQALALEPEYLWFYLPAGLIELKSNRYPQANYYFRRAVKIHPYANFSKMSDYARARYSIILWRLPLIGHQEFLLILSHKLKDGRQTAYRLLAFTLYKMRQYGALRVLAKRGRWLTAKNKSAVLFYTGLSAFERGKFSLARKIFTQALAAHPRNPEIMRYLGESLKQTGENAAADRMAAAVEKLAPPKHSYFIPLKGVTLPIF